MLYLRRLGADVTDVISKHQKLMCVPCSNYKVKMHGCLSCEKSDFYDNSFDYLDHQLPFVDRFLYFIHFFAESLSFY